MNNSKSDGNMLFWDAKMQCMKINIQNKKQTQTWKKILIYGIYAQ